MPPSLVWCCVGSLYRVLQETNEWFKKVTHPLRSPKPSPGSCSRPLSTPRLQALDDVCGGLYPSARVGVCMCSGVFSVPVASRANGAFALFRSIPRDNNVWLPKTTVQTHARSTAGLHALAEASVTWFKATSSGDINASSFRRCQQMMRHFVLMLDFSFQLECKVCVLGSGASEEECVWHGGLQGMLLWIEAFCPSHPPAARALSAHVNLKALAKNASLDVFSLVRLGSCLVDCSLLPG